MSSKLLPTIAALLVATLVVACTTSSTGRRQLILFSSQQMGQMGATAFNEMKEKNPPVSLGSVNQYVTCVADSVLAVLPGNDGRDWEIAVFDDDSANAFALPGRKIGVHAGLLKVAKDQHQLAAVIGHEIAHVLEQHSAERMSIQFAAEAGQQVVAASMDPNSPYRNGVMQALGLGTQVGVLLPWGRTQESEADVVGLMLMAKAGFNPQSSLTLWQNMAAQGKGQPPEFLSTHPSHSTRTGDLEEAMPQAINLYQRARSSGKRPSCRA